MPCNKYFQAVFLVVLSALLASACSAKEEALKLAEFTKNSVTVSIYLSAPKDGTSSLVAAFVPLNGLHLYSKDIPRNGVDGLGRPTLLELTQDSQIMAAGDLMESVPAQFPDFEPRDLLVYPAGMVTLTLPVTFPIGKSWVDDEISVTYMACNDTGCRAPVVDQIIAVHIPIQ
ncbi:MAG: hypothetical protein HZB18_02810 [Chloroflexi bacterium]|nr:hypothetical protein [Chloroflexota bacterium]